MLARDRPPLAATYGKLEDVTPVPHFGKRRCAYGVEGKLLIGCDQPRERESLLGWHPGFYHALCG